MLYTKSIFKPKEDDDGVRISVMSRHTLNDGVTPDERITLESFDEHLQVLAPPLKLIGDYYRRGLSWEGYVERYLHYIRSSAVVPHVSNLAERALGANVTLLCVEDIADKCHRRLIAEECKIYQHSLEVIHR